MSAKQNLPYFLAILLCWLTTDLVQAQPTPVNAATVADEALTIEGSLTLRDPFRRPVFKETASLHDGGNVPELERFDIDKFKLVGVITGPKKHKALVTSPDGKMHIVAESMRIGTRRGVVRRVGPGLVSIEERVVNLLGQEEKIESLIQFEKDEKK